MSAPSTVFIPFQHSFPSEIDVSQSLKVKDRSDASGSASSSRSASPALTSLTDCKSTMYWPLPPGSLPGNLRVPGANGSVVASPPGATFTVPKVAAVESVKAAPPPNGSASCPHTPPADAPAGLLDSPYFLDEFRADRLRRNSNGNLGQGLRPASFHDSDDLEALAFHSSRSLIQARRRTMTAFSPGGSSTEFIIGTDAPPQPPRVEEDQVELQLRVTPGRSGKQAAHLNPIFEASGSRIVGSMIEAEAGKVATPVKNAKKSTVGEQPPASGTREAVDRDLQPRPSSLPYLDTPPAEQTPPTKSRLLQSSAMTPEPRSSSESARLVNGLLPSRGISRANTPAPLPLNSNTRDPVPVKADKPPRASTIKKAAAPAAYEGTETITLSKRAQLLRTARKAEQTLGQTLSEDAVERYIVDPTLMEKTVLTHFEAGWPESPAVSTVPEWQREDCVPRRQLNRTDSTIPAPAAPRGPLSWIKDLAKGRKAAPLPTELQVRIEREIRVAETWQPSDSVIPTNASTTSLNRFAPKQSRLRKGPVPSELEVHIEREVCIAEDWDPEANSPGPYGALGANRGPGSPTVSVSPAVSPLLEEHEEIARRARRLQLAKLQRLLGTQVPHHLLPEVAIVDGMRTAAHKERSPSVDSSKSWTHRLSTIMAMPVEGVSSDDASSQTGMSDHDMKDKHAGHKRASILDPFYDAPPQYARYGSDPMSARSEPIPSGSDSTHSSDVFEAYRDSISCLINLVEHDQGLLASIVDELDTILPCEVSTTVSATSSPTTWKFSLRSPSSNSLSPHSSMPQQSAWRNNRKLSKIFGERAVETSSYSSTQRPSCHARRAATLDGVLKEMWTSVQAEVGRGALKATEANKLIEMMGNFKRKRELSSWAEL